MRYHIFEWDHISDKLTRDQLKELKSYYKSYHKKSWAYKKLLKRLKKWKLLGNSTSVIFATGGIVSAVATSGFSLAAVSTVSLLIQSWMKHKDLDLKIHNCTYAYQSYEHLLNTIKDMMRSGDFDSSILYQSMNNIDNYVGDNSPIIDKYLKKYDNYFITD